MQFPTDIGLRPLDLILNWIISSAFGLVFESGVCVCVLLSNKSVLAQGKIELNISLVNNFRYLRECHTFYPNEKQTNADKRKPNGICIAKKQNRS